MEARARRVLAVSRVTPNQAGVGSVFLRPLLRAYPQDRIVFATWNHEGVRDWPSELNGLAHHVVSAVPEYGFPFGGRLLRRLTRWHHTRYARAVPMRRALRALVTIGKQQGVEAVWITLASPTEIQLAAPLAQALGVPLLTMVWDPPQHYLRLFWGLEGRALAEIECAFACAIRASETCAVASDAMKAEYERRYRVPCVPLIHGFPRSEWRQPRSTANDERSFVIGYAGSIYAHEEWRSLLRALGQCGWRIDGRDVVLRVLASTLHTDTVDPVRIEHLGWRQTAETLRLLSEVDISYVPYWFDRRHSEAVRLCFPNKIPTYLAAGRPIFFHGPPDSTPARFLDEYKVGVVCHSVRSGDIVTALTDFARDQTLSGRFEGEAQRALEERFDERVFFKHFAAFMGVDAALLNGP